MISKDTGDFDKLQYKLALKYAEIMDHAEPIEEVKDDSAIAADPQNEDVFNQIMEDIPDEPSLDDQAEDDKYSEVKSEPSEE